MAEIKEYLVRLDATFTGCFTLVRATSLHEAEKHAVEGSFSSSVVTQNAAMSDWHITNVKEAV